MDVSASSGDSVTNSIPLIREQLVCVLASASATKGVALTFRLSHLWHHQCDIHVLRWRRDSDRRVSYKVQLYKRMGKLISLNPNHSVLTILTDKTNIRIYRPETSAWKDGANGKGWRGCGLTGVYSRLPTLLWPSKRIRLPGLSSIVFQKTSMYSPAEATKLFSPATIVLGIILARLHRNRNRNAR